MDLKEIANEFWREYSNVKKNNEGKYLLGMVQFKKSLTRTLEGPIEMLEEKKKEWESEGETLIIYYKPDFKKGKLILESMQREMKFVICDEKDIEIIKMKKSKEFGILLSSKL